MQTHALVYISQSDVKRTLVFHDAAQVFVIDDDPRVDV